ncbi:MAG: nucleoside 2-deoxyribosyltransferase domain-containing protein [Planctomycetota bacterium]
MTRSMQLVWATETPPSSFSSAIFLAGPTPRSDQTESWRPQCLSLLEQRGYDGVVFIPEPRSGEAFSNYDSQVEWERMGLAMADVILFWVPRDLSDMPAFTTNVEWGMWYDSGKAVFGAPSSAPKNTYLRHYAKRAGVPHCNTLESTVDATLEMVGEGALRHGGEREVPLFIWCRDEFQNWYASHREVGHRLDGAEVLWQFRVGSKRHLFCWVLRANLHVPEENRNKRGEFLITRVDVALVLAWHRADDPLDSEVVLVKEFRSAASGGDGYVWELPGGSSFQPASPLEQASAELLEETGISLPADRFHLVDTRQSTSTLLTHRIHLFSVELNDGEIDVIRAQCGTVHGDSPTERCILHVQTLRQMLNNQSIDWTQLGMVYSTIFGRP